MLTCLMSFLYRRICRIILTEVSDFARSGVLDKLLNLEWSQKRQKGSETKANLPYAFEIRCVRIRPESGEDEFLITNLPHKEFPKRKIKELYHYRRGIESSYNYLKNSV